MFDTHVNLHGEAYEDDLEEVLTRARDAGVRSFLAICDRLDNFEDVLGIATSNADIWCSVGVHPHHTKDFPDLAIEDLTSRATHNRVVAIGETGLDFHYGYSAEDAQVRSLRLHIEAARQTNLPLILHTREADELMANVLEEEHATGAFQPLLHCYTGGHELAQRALKLNAYFSVSGILSFKRADEVRDVIQDIPLERVILETDCPYLAPTPFRGRRNEPAYLQHVAEALASLHGQDVEAIKRVTQENALRLFQKVESPV